jgi:LmbE family N-acetylglucosaminyl deacetylase
VTDGSEHIAEGERIVVVSPHLDDGVLSLGAAMASWAIGGAQVELLTVLGSDPESGAPAGGWDRRGGFATEGESARARREEDRKACAILGVTPAWLPFGSVDYERHGDEKAVLEAVAPRIEGADLVVLPGYPLTHPDHAWLVEVIASGGILNGRIGLYAEQPYAFRERAAMPHPVASEWLEDLVGSRIVFERVRTVRRDQLAKLRAVRRYRSQLRLLALSRRGGIPLLHLISSEARLGGEAIAWISPAHRTAGA